LQTIDGRTFPTSGVGTFATWRDVRVKSAFEGKAEVGLRGREGSF